MSSESEKVLAELRDLKAGSPGGDLPMVASNAHLHLPPNFSAFENVGQLIELAAQQQVGVLGVSNYYDYEVYGTFAKLARGRRIFPLFGIEIISMVEELRREGMKINDPGNPGKFYLCGKGITRFAERLLSSSPGTPGEDRGGGLGGGSSIGELAPVSRTPTQPSPGVPGEGKKRATRDALAYGMTEEARRILGRIRANDSTRMAKMIALLAEIFARHGVETGLEEAVVIDRVVARHGSPRHTVYLQERHVCQAFQERLFEIVPADGRAAKLWEIFGGAAKSAVDDAVAVQNEIRSCLMKAGKAAYVAETFVTFEDAFALVTELGGIPCYPVLLDGANPICGFEQPVAGLVGRIKERGIGFAEFIPIRNKPAILAEYVKTMRRSGIVITAGTEHNTLEMLPIEPTCVGGEAIPAEIRPIFWEGACVVAAHQYLTLNGQEGFVAGSGEDRIATLRRLGATVIQEYRGL